MGGSASSYREREPETDHSYPLNRHILLPVLTRLLRGGFPLHKVSKCAGHADIKITPLRYAKANASDLMDGADILDTPPTHWLRIAV